MNFRERFSQLPPANRGFTQLRIPHWALLAQRTMQAKSGIPNPSLRKCHRQATSIDLRNSVSDVRQAMTRQSGPEPSGDLFRQATLTGRSIESRSRIALALSMITQQVLFIPALHPSTSPLAVTTQSIVARSMMSWVSASRSVEHSARLLITSLPFAIDRLRRAERYEFATLTRASSG
jgi:hypothetical protein